MSLLEIKKIRLLIHEQTGPKVIELLQRLGILELTATTSKEELAQREKKVFSIDYTAGRVELAISFLSAYSKQSFLKEVLEQGRVAVSDQELEKTVHTFYYSDLVQETIDLSQNINNAKAKLRELDEEEKILGPWEDWETPLSYNLTTKETDTWLTRGSTSDLDNCTAELDDYSLVFYQRCSDQSLAVTFLHSDREVVRKMLSAHKIETVSLPARRGTPAEELERIKRARIKTNKYLESYHQQAKDLTVHLPKLKIIGDHLHWKKERFDTMYQLSGTASTLVLEGWIPISHLQDLEQQLCSITELYALEEVPAEDVTERPPSEIKNHALIEPFESVTRLYGLPSSGNLDPSPYLAGFFFVFFGICLSDVGYGLILAGLTSLTLYFYNIERSMASFMKLLMAGGISSILAGLLFGGYFGIDPQYLPQYLLYFQQFDPISNPLPIFYLALTLGVIQLLSGLILSIVREAKQGRLTEGLIDTLPWLAFFGALGWKAAELFEVIDAVGNLTTILIYLTLAAIVASKTWQSEGHIFKRLMMGILGLYGMVQYLSDTLSYSRLLALGLATSALAFSVNLIALVINEAVPYIGWILMIAVLVVGHIFNMAVNILSSFIHTARLQFVEFFGKFITDTERQLKPFQRQIRYTFPVTKSNSTSVSD